MRDSEAREACDAFIAGEGEGAVRKAREVAKDAAE
jgi:hypothetical protein